VYGDSVSSTAGNILLKVYPQGNPSTIISQLRATVISVSLSLNNNGSWSGDDSAASPTLKSWYASTLGPHVVPGPPGHGAYCAQVIEYMGTVTPSDYYQDVIAMWRTKNTKTFNGQTQRASGSGPDGPLSGNTVTVPNQGHVFDVDAPGQYPDLTSASEIWRARQNYTENALLDHAPTAGSSSIVLAELKVFARTSWRHLNLPPTCRAIILLE